MKKGNKSKDASTSTNREAITQEMRNGYRLVLREKEQLVEEIRAIHNEIKEAAVCFEKLREELKRVNSVRSDYAIPGGRGITPPAPLSPERFQSPPPTPPYSVDVTRIASPSAALQPPPVSPTKRTRSAVPEGPGQRTISTQPPKTGEERLQQSEQPKQSSRGTSPANPIKPPVRSTGTKTIDSPPPKVTHKSTSPDPWRAMPEGDKVPGIAEQSSQSEPLPKYREVVIPSGDQEKEKIPKPIIYQKRLVHVSQAVDDGRDSDSIMMQRELHMQIAAMHVAIQQRMCIAGAFIALLVFLILFY